jgi:hypothetical protein
VQLTKLTEINNLFSYQNYGNLMKSNILDKLKGGDLRSIGRSDEVVNDILNEPGLFEDVFNGISNPDPIIRMRAADVIEKVSFNHPEYLEPYKTRLISEMTKIDQHEV